MPYKFDYIKHIRGAEFYNQNLQGVNSTRRKYGMANSLMRKALDLAISTDSYDEFIGICHSFILDTQRSVGSDLILKKLNLM